LICKRTSPLRSSAAHLLEGEGISIIKFIVGMNLNATPSPRGRGLG